MFSAIVTGMLGLWGLSLLGLVDITRVYLLPTYLLPMAVGGLIFGVGMIVGGYCPGTAFAAVVTGKLDALVFAVGFVVGTLVFGDLFPMWERFYGADYRGVVRLDQLLGIGLGPMMLLVVLIAAGSTIGLRRLQQHFWHNIEGRAPAGVRWLVGLVVAATLVLAFMPNRAFFAIADTAGSVGGWEHPWADPYESVVVDPLTAGRIAYRHQDRLRLFDLRAGRQHQGGDLPGAVAITPAALETLVLDPASVVLVYGHQDDPQVRATVAGLRRRGLRAFAIEGGFAALKPYYLEPISPELKARLGTAKLSELETYRALWSPRQGPQAGAASP
jgi:hypothetical protein